MSTKITYIYPEDVDNLEVDAEDNYIVPDGYEIYKTPTKEEQMQPILDEIAKIEAMVEPTYKELIEWGKINYPYYHDRQMLVFLRDELNSIQDGN
jgi:hypothetical protein